MKILFSHQFVLLAFASLFLFAACSSSDPIETTEVTVEETVEEQATSEEPVTGLPLEGYDVEGMQTQNDVSLGTQQDLSTNIGDRVFFGYDRSDLSSEGRSLLERQAQWLQQYPNLNVVIEGHCDERGTRDYYLALGERRANTVRNYLVALGVNPSRVRTVSYGKERPAVLGSNPTAWAQNRRGVTIVE